MICKNPILIRATLIFCDKVMQKQTYDQPTTASKMKSRNKADDMLTPITMLRSDQVYERQGIREGSPNLSRRLELEAEL